MSTSASTLPTGPSVPDDIRLKCSYYASEIKNQVNSLYEEQHKWLEDHLSEIKETLVKVTEKKAGTRAVMAGIIKTPSRKRNKPLSKKISKPDQIKLDGLDHSKPSSSSSSALPLSELKRSHLNMNSREIQDLINQQLEKERKEIELRLQKELLLLDQQYESPVKKTSASSTLMSADLTKPPPPSFRNAVESLLSHKVNSTSSLSGPITITNENIFSLPSLSNPKAHLFEPVIKSLGPFSHEESEHEQGEPSHESQTDPNDAFAAAGHELSAIQEGEEEEDHHPAEPQPPLPKSLVLNKSVSEVLSPVKQASDPQNVETTFNTTRVDKPPTSPSQSKASPRFPKCQSSPPPPKPHSPHLEHTSTNTKNHEARVDESHQTALASDSSSAPETNSVDASGNSVDVSGNPVDADRNSIDAHRNAVDARSSDPDSIHLRALVSDEVPLVNKPPGNKVQGPAPNAIDVQTSGSRTIPATSDSLPLNPTVSSQVSHESSAIVNRPLTPEHPAISSPKQTTPPTLTSNQDQGGNLGIIEPTSSVTAATTISTATPRIKQEFGQNAQQPLLQEAPHSVIPEHSHVDTVVEIPLTDNPSSLRNNLHASSGSSHSDKQTDHQARTPGEPTMSNLFTPGNPRAAVIQSPHSQWSSKPSGTLWTQHKPHKTPATISHLGAASQGERMKSTISGSPFEDYSKPLNLLSNLQSTMIHQSLVSDTPSASSLVQPIPGIDSQHSRRSGLKRTSTDAGFNQITDAHDAKMSRSHTPGMMHVRPSTTGGTARKGMEDLKSRLSKIQRESAMHERVHHHPSSGPSADGSLSVNPRTSLVTQTIAPSFSKAPTTSNSLASVVPVTKGSTLPPSHAVASDQLDRDRTTEMPTLQQTLYGDFSAPIELSASSKIHVAHSSTEPINLQSRVTPVKPSASSKKFDEDVQDEAPSVHSPETQAGNQKKRASDSSSVGNMVAAHEAKSKTLTTQVHIAPLAMVDLGNGLRSSPEVSSVPPPTKIDSKHLAFLRGDIERSTSPPPTRVLGKSSGPPRSEAGDLINRPVESGHGNPETTVDTDDEEGEDCQSVTSSKISEGNAANNEDEEANLSSEDEEDHGNHSEREDDDTHEEASLEIVSSNDKRIFINNSDHEQESRNRQEPNQKHHVRTMQSEVVKTPRKAPATPSSPSSTGIMGVFRAGAALASSWTASKTKPEKPELKSLQLAAAAAKKEQDERDRKAMLKEERRLLAVEKKLAEEKAKAENERKARMAEVEKKKQEREDALKARSALKAKVPSNHPPSGSRQASMAGDAAKKRKVDNESHRTMETKKTKAPQPVETHNKIPSSAQKAPASSYLPTRTAPTAPGSAMKTAPGSAIKATSSKGQQAGGSTSTKQSSQVKSNLPSRPVSQLSQHSGVPKSTATPQHNASQSSHNNATQNNKSTQAAKGKMREEKKVVEDEYIELPDIDSEYSDDDESEHERKEAKLPDWAQSPALREALANQRKVNPDDVFGGTIPPPRMDEIFRGRTSKFRHRTSSANWTGADQLTAIEEAEYAKRMGYHNKKRSLKR